MLTTLNRLLSFEDLINLYHFPRPLAEKLRSSLPVWGIHEGQPLYLESQVDAFLAAYNLRGSTFESEVSPQPAPAQVDRPTWDADRRELRWGDRLIKRYRQEARHQVRVLRAFEDSGWPVRIESPFLRKTGKELGDIIDALNAHHKAVNLIRFSRNGAGGILWSKVPG